MALKICLIVAMARNRVIGMNGAMPWRISTDLKRFKQLTMTRPLIMGRKTFESIGKPLEGRMNLVVTRNPSYPDDGIYVVNDMAGALKAAEAFSRITLDPEVMVAGGAEIYRQALPMADRIYMTEIAGEPEGDAYFPELIPEEWREIAREDHPATPKKDDYPFTFITYDRAR